ncbi:hypothetical protein [Nonomuraea glycinis]|uniref:hypothetical protein n=1 Tax=Nonomuraea glycinis TaxID=2047744 RepID=UPI0033A1482C
MNSTRGDGTPAALLGRPPADTIPYIDQITITMRMADGTVTVIDMPKPSDAHVDHVVEEMHRDDSYLGFSPRWPDHAKQTFTLTVDLNRAAEHGEPTLVVQLDPPAAAPQPPAPDALALLQAITERTEATQ